MVVECVVDDLSNTLSILSVVIGRVDAIKKVARRAA
jgi:hypothetical protein